MIKGQGEIAGLRERVPFQVIDPAGLPLRERSDEALMLDHGKGSTEAFEELVRRHQRGVLNYLYRMVQNRHVAEELTQEVFVALVRNAERYEPTAKFTTYLYRIAANVAAKEWTRAKRRPKLFSLSSAWGWGKDGSEDPRTIEDRVEDENACVLASFQRGEISEAVNTALKRLPEHQREAFVLRRFKDMPYEEIAKVTNTPVGTLKSRVVRAERALRPLLEKFREYV
jgi:RNA polymerase sigma-70 factor (ECF subfamily)